MKVGEVLLGLVAPLISPIAKLIAKGAIKIVLATKTVDDDKLLKEIAKEILDAMGSEE